MHSIILITTIPMALDTDTIAMALEATADIIIPTTIMDYSTANIHTVIIVICSICIIPTETLATQPNMATRTVLSFPGSKQWEYNIAMSD